MVNQKLQEQQARQLINQFTVIIGEVEVPKFEIIELKGGINYFYGKSKITRTSIN